MSRIRLLVIATLAASFLVYVPTASAAPGDPITGFTAEQCANGAAPSTSKACPEGWIGGSLNSSKSHYREDEVVPQRLLMNIPAGGDSHTLTISYMTRKKGGANAHAFDYLATWDRTQNQATPCESLAASICAGPPSTLQMASDNTSVQPIGSGISANTSAHELPPGDRQWTMYGAATLTSTTGVTHTEPTDTNKDDEASVTLTIKGSAAGGQALLLFGGHLAVSGVSTVPRAWGPGMGASAVSGGPYHIGLSAVDGKKQTAQNNIQAGAVQPLAPANFTIEKTANAETATPGQEVEYTVTVTNTGEESGSTTFVDDYDDALDPSEVTSDPPGGSCNESAGTLSCQTGSIPGGGQQTFTYTATMPETLEGDPGTAGCAAGEFPITNTATLAGDIGEDSVTVCVAAAPEFTIEKSVDNETATPGQDVEYTIAVTNNGSTSGSTSFVDDFDDDVNPGDVTSDPTGGTCNEGGGTLSCTTSSIAPGDTQTFTYTAAMPETFEGDSGTGGCATGSFPITNTATLDGDAGNDSVTVCVAASPEFTITKSAEPETAAPGEDVTYTITVENTGSTSGSTTFVDVADGDVSPGEVTSDPDGAECAVITNTVSCETSSIAPGDTQTFTYTAAMPETFEGDSGTGGCETGFFPVTNTVTLAEEAGEDSVTVCVEAAAAFTISKSVDDETPTPGQTVTYTITVENTGSAPGSTSFDDDFDNRLDPGEVTSDPTGGTCNEADGVLSCDTSSIPAGDTQTFTYSAQIPATIEGESGTGGCDPGFFPVANSVTLDGDAGDDSVTVCVEAAAAFTITKTAEPETAAPGEDVVYTITVENVGSTSGATSFVDVADGDVSPGEVTSDPTGAECAVITNTVSCETSSIAPGNTQTFTYTAAMPETFEGDSGTGGCDSGFFPVTNTVTLAEEAGEDSVTVCVEAAAAFIVEKTADAETAEPGQEVTYTITVTNTGTASGTTSFVDDFDDDVDPGDVTIDPVGGTCNEAGGTLSCETSSILAGDTQTFTYTVTLPETFENESGTGGCDPGFFPVANSVTLDGEAGDDSVTVCVEAAPAFTITKSADPETATPGEDVVYTITVENTGSTSGATSFVDVADGDVSPGEVTSDPTGAECAVITNTVSCETSSIAPGNTQTFTYTAAMPETFEGESGTGGCDAGYFPVTNTVTLAEEAGEDSVTVCVEAAAEFTITKSADDESAEPGQEITYTITVENTGSTGGATSFVDDFDDRLEPGEVTIDPTGGTCNETGGTLSCETSSIPAGDTQTFTYTVTLPETFEGDSGTGGCETGEFPVSNTATLAEEAGDDSVTVCVAAAPEFTIDKTVDDETAIPGQEITYTITVENTGSTTGSTSFVDDFDDRVDPSEVTSDPVGGTCDESGGTLSCDTSPIAPGDTQTFTYTATVPETFEGESGTGGCETGFFPISNTADLDGEAGDDSVTVCVEASPEFTIEKSADDLTASPGQTITYTITVENTGSTGGTTSFVDDFDNRLEPMDVTSDPEGGSCSLDNGALSCDTGAIAPGDTQTFTYTAALPETFEGESGTGGCETGEFPIDNTATLEAGGDDTVTVCVAAAPEFTIDKTVDDETAEPGQEITYTITVENTGSTSGSTSFVDNFDDDVDPSEVTSDPTGGTCNEADGVLTCDTSSIAPGDTQTFTYTATVPATFEGESGTGGCEPGSFPISNTATLDGDAGADSATVCVEASPAFTIEKEVDVATPTPGQEVEYTITVTNTGTASGGTSFVDDYDDRLDPSLPVSDPEGGECTAAPSENEAFSCETGTIPAGDSQTFIYTATIPPTFEGESGTGGCEPGSFPIENTVTLDGEGGSDGVTVCVVATPDLTVTKSADNETPTPGQDVTYTIMVENNGTASGSTTFVDDFDDRLDPSTPEADSEGGSCTLATDGDNKRFECETGTILAGGVQTFTYTAAMPATFSGASGDEPCEPGGYPVANTVTLDGGEPQTVTVCVQAAPELSLVKSVETDHDSAGNEFLTYTLEYTNNGPADAPSALINDEIPEGTTFEECSDECDTTGSPVSSATWAVGPIEADGGTGKVTLTVLVTTKVACEVSNVATIQFGLAPPVSSNTVVTQVTPVGDPDGARANGSAKGAQVVTSGLVNLPPRFEQPISTAATSQNGLGGPQLDDESILTIKVPNNGSILRADALRTTSSSVVTAAPAAARQTSTAEVAKVCIVPIAGKCTVEANTIRAVASTFANGTTASFSSAGSTIQNLKVVGIDTPVDLNQTTKIPLNKNVFGAGSYVAIGERTGPGGEPRAGLSGGAYSADLTVTMIHVKITGVLGLQAAEVIVSQATAHSDFPETLGCGRASNNTVSGHAFVAGLTSGPILADLLLGYTQLAPLGGTETEHVVDLKVPGNGSVLSAKVADSSSQGAVNALNATASTLAEVAGDGATPACILRSGAQCVLSADAVRSASQSTANAGGASSSSEGTRLLGFKIAGVPGYTAGRPPPNHTVALPGIGFLILNEQVCDGGTQTYTNQCTGASHSGLTVRGVRIVVTVAKNLLGLQPGIELVIAEAHSDATFN